MFVLLFLNLVVPMLKQALWKSAVIVLMIMCCLRNLILASLAMKVSSFFYTLLVDWGYFKAFLLSDFEGWGTS